MVHSRKILIANRGEIACRIIRACQLLNYPTIAVHSEPDRSALHVEMADEAIALDGINAKDTYGNSAAILAAAQASDAAAIHPGYGFFSENPDFANAVSNKGLTWIGPRPSTIAKMGDKSQARAVAHTAGVPVVPGTTQFVASNIPAMLAAGEHVGYPLLVKASGGGGGLGMKVVEHPNDLEPAVQAIQSMVGKAFGESSLYLEKYIPAARHIEIQIFGFGDGSGVHLYERDCSLQRRFQKIVEETPALAIPATTLERMYSHALSLVAIEKYSGAGTVEFIVDTTTGEAYFLEMNTRIQVEHPVTEMITGVDLVQWQIMHAFGVPVKTAQTDIHKEGHAIECRIYAEKPERNFFPAPGHITELVWPQGHGGVRIDDGVRQGDDVTPYYDPLIGKVICHAADRRLAINRMTDTLDSVVINGIDTNVDFLRTILMEDQFIQSKHSTKFIEEYQNRIQ